ncbi:hypothetical protein F5Y16DRAFT_130416 [Xylariaceae sp. FL0255]|nr:hypothetical protein F5Y16DRAFT_130416 [Xylariaceae sp. FL0255]
MSANANAKANNKAKTTATTTAAATTAPTAKPSDKKPKQADSASGTDKGEGEGEVSYPRASQSQPQLQTNLDSYTMACIQGRAISVSSLNPKRSVQDIEMDLLTKGLSRLTIVWPDQPPTHSVGGHSGWCHLAFYNVDSFNKGHAILMQKDAPDSKPTYNATVLSSRDVVSSAARCTEYGAKPTTKKLSKPKSTNVKEDIETEDATLREMRLTTLPKAWEYNPQNKDAHEKALFSYYKDLATCYENAGIKTHFQIGTDEKGNDFFHSPLVPPPDDENDEEADAQYVPVYKEHHTDFGILEREYEKLFISRLVE